MKWAAKASLSLVTISSLLVGATASAGEFGLSAGYYHPALGSGDPGVLGSITLLDSDPESQWRWGGELEYRRYEIEIEGFSGVDTQDVVLNGVLHFRLWPDKITPYFGLGVGLGLNIIARNDLAKAIIQSAHTQGQHVVNLRGHTEDGQ